MSQFKFCYYQDHEDGKMARVETAGDEYESGIPVNIFIDNAEEHLDMEEGLCSIEVCGVGSDFTVYPDEASYEAAGTNFASVSMIPMGTFAPPSEERGSGESPHIMYSGRVMEVERAPACQAPEPNIRIGIETLGLCFDLFTRYDGPVEPGNNISGVAWLFGNIASEDDKTEVRS